MLEDRAEKVRRASNDRYARLKEKVLAPLSTAESCKARNGGLVVQTLTSDTQISGRISVPRWSREAAEPLDPLSEMSTTTRSRVETCSGSLLGTLAAAIQAQTVLDIPRAGLGVELPVSAQSVVYCGHDT